MNRPVKVLGGIVLTLFVIVVLLGLLMPSLCDDCGMANRAVCSSNIRAFIQSETVYAQQNNNQFSTVEPPLTPGRFANRPNPFAGAPQGTVKAAFAAIYPRGKTVGQNAGGVTACMWTLVLAGQMTPKSFICPSDPFTHGPATEVYATGNASKYAYDFGSGVNGSADPVDYFGESYSIACPWSPRAKFGANHLNAWWNTHNGGDVPIMSDMAPQNIRSSSAALDRDVTLKQGRTPARPGRLPDIYSSGNHRGDGENIGFADAHVSWHTDPFAGENGDNIFAYNVHGSGPQATTAGLKSSGGFVNVPGGKGGWHPGKKGKYDTLMLPVQNLSNGKF